MRVLVVDDDRELCRVASWTLEKMATCSVAHDVASATRELDAVHFDLVLIDVALGKESGLELLDEVQKRWPDTAATMISGTDDLTVAQEALGRGALAYLVKPFRVNDLRIHVASACAAHRRMRVAGRSSLRARVVTEMGSILSKYATAMCVVVEFQQLPLLDETEGAACSELRDRVVDADLRLVDLNFCGALGKVSFVFAGRGESDVSTSDTATLVRLAIDANAPRY
jgi:DNA-binding response OmpR family regulator